MMELIVHAIQDAKSESPHTSTPHPEAETTFLDRVDSPWKVGAHVSAAGGVENAVTNAAAIGSVTQTNRPVANLWTYNLFIGRILLRSFSNHIVNGHHPL